MKLYVNCITSGAELRNDIKVLIPEMNLRRRMGRLVKSGVAAGIESLLAFGDRAPIDAVITATGLGCIADSEKFLEGLIANQEAMLNPTPFIQSTFNTVGAQIALLRGLHCYNTTYAHRWASFENALTDAALRLGAGLSRAVLVGAFDETTPTVETILNRLGAIHQGSWGESSVFFVLTAEAFDTTVAAITGIRFPEGIKAADEQDTGERRPSGKIAAGRSGCCERIGGEGTDKVAGKGDPDNEAGADNGTTEVAGSNPLRTPGCGAVTSEEPANGNTAAGVSDGEVREIYATQTGVVPHFTAIAEAFRRVVAGNAGEAGNSGDTGSTGNTENTGNAGNNRNAGEAGSTENTGSTGKTGNTGNTVATGNDRSKEIAGRRIVLYNDFPGEVISAIELTCM